MKILMKILYAIVYLLISMLILFYLDLANGPFYLFAIEVFILILCVIVHRILRHRKFLIRRINTLLLVLLTGVVVAFAHPKKASKSPVNYSNIKYCETTVLNGKIKGVYNEDSSVEIYAGIPYAKAPVGQLRWKEPQDPENWSGTLDCTMFKPKSMQKESNEVFSSLADIYAQKQYVPDLRTQETEYMSEDSLYLNVWKPNTTKTNLPILMFIHGGSLNSGSSSFDDYNGETLAKNEVIMITITYRLGIFGYFASEELIEESSNNTTGNYGLLDQIKALEWVNNNASALGGDKNNITIAGESAGSSSVSALCTSPLAKGLFKRAIGESSSLVTPKPPHTYRTMEKALEMGNDILKEFNCKSVKELRRIDASKLVNTKYDNNSMTLDNYALTKNPYEVYQAHENNEEALLNGCNAKEADPFVIPTYLFNPTNKNNILEHLNALFDENLSKEIIDLYKDDIENDAFGTFNKIVSAYWFIYPHYNWSNMALANNEDVYRYYFTKENGYYGTYHSGEMIYFYGNISRKNKTFAYDNSDYELSSIMQNYIINFIKTGNPNQIGLPVWGKYQNDNKILELNNNVSMIDDEFISLFNLFIKYEL